MLRITNFEHDINLIKENQLISAHRNKTQRQNFGRRVTNYDVYKLVRYYFNTLVKKNIKIFQRIPEINNPNRYRCKTCNDNIGIGLNRINDVTICDNCLVKFKNSAYVLQHNIFNMGDIIMSGINYITSFDIPKDILLIIYSMYYNLEIHSGGPNNNKVRKSRIEKLKNILG